MTSPLLTSAKFQFCTQKKVLFEFKKSPFQLHFFNEFFFLDVLGMFVNLV